MNHAPDGRSDVAGARAPASRPVARAEFEVRSGIRFRSLAACPCCGSAYTSAVLTDGRDFETDLGRFAVRECHGCRIQFTDPQPLPEDVPLLYASRDAHDFEDSEGIIDRLRRFNHYRQLRRLPRERLGADAISLDYGCGSGLFTRSMRRFLPGKVIGSDFHDSPPPTISESADIEYVPDARLGRLQESLQLIICRNVLEHTAEPLRFLARLRSLLRPGGLLYIEVPNRRSVWMRLMGGYNFNYYLPRHLFHYDEHTLAAHLVDYRVLDRWFDHSPILGKSFGQLVGRRVSGYSPLGMVLLPMQLLVDAAPGYSSQLVVMAERV